MYCPRWYYRNKPPLSSLRLPEDHIREVLASSNSWEESSELFPTNPILVLLVEPGEHLDHLLLLHSPSVHNEHPVLHGHVGLVQLFRAHINNPDNRTCKIFSLGYNPYLGSYSLTEAEQPIACCAAGQDKNLGYYCQNPN